MKEIKDALDAADVTLRYLSKKGIVVFRREIESIFKHLEMCEVMIYSEKFTGIIKIKSIDVGVIK